MFEIVSSKRHPFRPGYLFVRIFQKHWFIYKRNFLMTVELILKLFVLVEFTSQDTEPFVWSVDLCVWLIFAVSDVSLSPLGETFGDLLDTTDWVVFVVSWAEFSFTVKEGKLINFTSFSWSTVFGVLIVESAQFPSFSESSGVFVELLYPVCSSLGLQVSIAPFGSKDVQFLQTLERVSWWDFSFCRSNSNDGSDGEFHFVYLNPYRSFDEEFLRWHHYKWLVRRLRHRK